MSDPAEESDHAVMLRLRGGDDRALNELISRWQGRLIRFLHRFTGNESDAEDLAEETFFRIYEHRSSYDDRAKFSTWLYTIAGNLCRNHARWKSRHPTVSLEAPSQPETDFTLADHMPATGRTPAEDAAADELAHAIRNAIQSLPEDQRTATILFEYEDQSHAEIATILRCSPKAVETRLYRARQFLRERLAKWLK